MSTSISMHDVVSVLMVRKEIGTARNPQYVIEFKATDNKGVEVEFALYANREPEFIEDDQTGDRSTSEERAEDEHGFWQEARRTEERLGV